jgi:hypothetical protein
MLSKLDYVVQKCSNISIENCRNKDLNQKDCLCIVVLTLREKEVVQREKTIA